MKKKKNKKEEDNEWMKDAEGQDPDRMIKVLFDIPEKLIKEWKINKSELYELVQNATRKALGYVFEYINKLKGDPDVYS